MSQYDIYLIQSGSNGFNEFQNTGLFNISGTQINFGAAGRNAAVVINGTGTMDKIIVGSTNTVPGTNSAAVGGTNNIASGIRSIVLGGTTNVVTSSATSSAILGGANNTVYNTSSVVVGGNNNTASGVSSFIGGGGTNTIIGNTATIIGGTTNIINSNGNHSFIAGGGINTVSNSYSTIVGGQGNNISGQFSNIWGGYSNSVSGDYACALGSYSKVYALHTGAAVWSDSQASATKVSSGNDSLALYFAGGTYVANNLTVGGTLTAASIVSASIIPTRTPITGAYTLSLNDYIIGIRGTGVGTIQLLTAASTSGRMYVIKDEIGTGAAYPTLIKPSGSNLIEGQTGYYVNANRMAVSIYSDGSGWQIF